MIALQTCRGSPLSLRVLAACLALGGGWLLIRALVLGNYTFVEYAIQAGALSWLACLVILARMRSRGELRARPTEIRSSYSVLDWARLALSVGLLIAAFVCQLWWVVQISHGLFLKRLQFGLDPFTKIALGLWAACILVCPKPPLTEHSSQRDRLPVAFHWLWILLLVWTYPYTDPFSRYVQWSGLYLMVVASLAIWQLAAWFRGEVFVSNWLNCLAKLFVPDDFMIREPSPDTNFQSDPATGQRRVLLIAICTGAMVMQAINVSWGLPPNESDREFRQYHPDEKDTFEQAWRLYIDPQPVVFVRGGSAFFRLGMFAKDVAVYFTDPEFTMRLQILLLRWVNIVSVGGGVFLAYASGRALFDQRTALVAALVMAILPGNVVTAHPARPESIFTLLCSAGLYTAIRAQTGPAAPQWLRIGGLILGISTAMKVTGVGLFAPLMVALALGRPTRAQFVGRLAQIGVTAAVGYVLASFETFFFLHRFFEGIVFTRNLQGARGGTDIVRSIATYLGPVSGYAWTIPGTILLWVGAGVAARRRACWGVIAFLLAGHAISFVQRDTTLRSHVHLSASVSLLVAYLLTMVLDACQSTRWLRRVVVGAQVATILFIAQESLGHVAYLRFGTDARVKVTEWIERNIPPERTVGITPYYHGDWGTVPPLDELRRRVVLLPMSKMYDASDYKHRDLDYLIMSDLIMESSEISSDAEDFKNHVRSEQSYRLIQTYEPSFEAIHPAEWLGWRPPGDWRYTRPTFYLYERKRGLTSTQEIPQ